MSGMKLEEIDSGFFDQIDDLLEFPNDDVEKDLVDNGVAIQYNDFPPVFWSENSPVFSAATSNSASDLSAELSVPYEDIVQLEWLSTFVEDSFAVEGLTLEKSQSTSSTKGSSRNQFQTSSPISVLESSTTCSKGKMLPASHEKRARSKRPRPATFKPGAHLISPTSYITKISHHALLAPNASLSDSQNFAETRPLKKKKKIKILPAAGGISQNQNENPNANPTLHPLRKCMHCEITKTPQWRAGPMGPKTLCNACGVRYKSGRLFPEYRPAASPTFVPSLHSNSHKKVLEMRTKITDEEKPVLLASPVARSCQQGELIPKRGLLPACM